MENSTRVMISLAAASVVGAGVALLIHESDSPAERKRKELTHRLAGTVTRAADSAIDTIRSAAGKISDGLN